MTSDHCIATSCPHWRPWLWLSGAAISISRLPVVTRYIWWPRCWARMINESGVISDAGAGRWYVLCQHSFKFSPSTDLHSFISWAALEPGLFSPHKQVQCSVQENLFHFKIFLIFRTQLFLHKHRLYSLLLATYSGPPRVLYCCYCKYVNHRPPVHS